MPGHRSQTGTTGADLHKELTSCKQQLSVLEEVTRRGAEQVQAERQADSELHDEALRELRADMQRSTEQHDQLTEELMSYKQQLSAFEEVTRQGAEQVQAESQLRDKVLQELRGQLQSVQGRLEQQRADSVEQLVSIREQLAAAEARIQQGEAKLVESQLDLKGQQREFSDDRQAWEELRDREHISQRAPWLEDQVTEADGARQRLKDQLQSLRAELERAGDLQAARAAETSRVEQQRREWLTQRARLDEQLAAQGASLNRAEVIADSTPKWEPWCDGGSTGLPEPPGVGVGVGEQATHPAQPLEVEAKAEFEPDTTESHEDSRPQASRNRDRPNHDPSLPLENRLTEFATRAKRLSRITYSAGSPPRLAQRRPRRTMSHYRFALRLHRMYNFPSTNAESCLHSPHHLVQCKSSIALWY